MLALYRHCSSAIDKLMNVVRNLLIFVEQGYVINQMCNSVIPDLELA